MSVEERVELVERLRAILHEYDDEEIARGDALVVAVEGVHPADIAEAMSQLADAEALSVFSILDNTRAAEVLDELDGEKQRYLLDNDIPGRIAGLLDLLPMDDAARVVAEAAESDPERAEEIMEQLAVLAPADAAEIQELLSYAEQTAGRLMTDKYVRIPVMATVEEAFQAIRSAGEDVEMLSTVYITEPVADGEERLVGVLGLRELVRATPERPVRELMLPEPISVTVDTDQEEVANLISKYDLNSLPVLDRKGNLAGIVTIDDVVDILVAEQTEDVLKQGAVEPGVMDAPYFSVPVWRVVRSRVGWLILLFVAETATGYVLRGAESELAKVTALSFFIPLLIGTGGNTGAQTVSTLIRGMALKEVRLRDTGRVLVRELGSGLLLGLLLGTIGFVRALLWNSGLPLSLVVGLSILAICTWANLIGSIIPLAAQKLKIDPALVSAPLITTLVDATGLAIYLGIAKLLLEALH